MRALALAGTLILCSPERIACQIASSAAESTFTSAKAGSRAGEFEARQPRVAGSFVVGFLGGTLLGLGGGYLIADDKGQVPWIFVGAGVGAIATTVSSAGDSGSLLLPDSIERRLQTQLPEYQSAFRSAYASRLKARRQRASVWGAVAGTATGGWLIYSVLKSWAGN